MCFYVNHIHRHSFVKSPNITVPVDWALYIKKRSYTHFSTSFSSFFNSISVPTSDLIHLLVSLPKTWGECKEKNSTFQLMEMIWELTPIERPPLSLWKAWTVHLPLHCFRTVLAKRQIIPLLLKDSSFWTFSFICPCNWTADHVTPLLRSLFLYS